MNLTVIGPRVLVRPDVLPEMTADGLLHLVYDNQLATVQGVVVAVGDGAEYMKKAAVAAVDAFCVACRLDPCLADIVLDAFVPEHSVEIGEHVLFSPSDGQELIFEKEVLVCLREDDILAVID